GTVRARRPVGEFLAGVLGATPTYFEHVICLQPNLLGDPASQMRCQLTNVLQMEAGVESEDIPVTFGTRHIAMSGFVPVCIGLPDLVAARAGASAGVTVVKARARQEQNYQQGDRQGRYN